MSDRAKKRLKDEWACLIAGYKEWRFWRKLSTENRLTVEYDYLRVSRFHEIARHRAECRRGYRM